MKILKELSQLTEIQNTKKKKWTVSYKEELIKIRKLTCRDEIWLKAMNSRMNNTGQICDLEDRM